jgi:hypothetical protein
MLRVLFLGLPALIFVLGFPLALGWVSPNRFYGFRTATTFSSFDAWYRINFATGVALIVAGVLSGMAVFLLDHGVIALKPEARHLVGILLTGLFLLASLIPVVLYSDRF